MSKSFPAKILLFGEYTVLQGSSALAIPYNKYSGQWKPNVSDELNGFLEHISKIAYVNNRKTNKAIREKWGFESTIPMGYGLGSSGALTAAAYSEFYEKKNVGQQKTKEILAEMESFFHGKSSGLDPLTSYFNSPMLVDYYGIKQLTDLQVNPKLFILDSGIKRDSKSLIESFNKSYANNASFKVNIDLLMKLNNDIIRQSYANSLDIESSFRQISEIQYFHMEEMIPNHIKVLWRQGWNDNSYWLKLSGAGGGGCFLGLSIDGQLPKNAEWIYACYS